MTKKVPRFHKVKSPKKVELPPEKNTLPVLQQKEKAVGRKGQSIFFQMHTNNLIQMLEVVALDWSASRQPDDYICLEFTIPKAEAAITLSRLELSRADFFMKHKADLVEITLKNVVSMWADTLRFWR